MKLASANFKCGDSNFSKKGGFEDDTSRTFPVFNRQYVESLYEWFVQYNLPAQYLSGKASRLGPDLTG